MKATDKLIFYFIKKLDDLKKCKKVILLAGSSHNWLVPQAMKNDYKPKGLSIAS